MTVVCFDIFSCTAACMCVCVHLCVFNVCVCVYACAHVRKVISIKCSYWMTRGQLSLGHCHWSAERSSCESDTDWTTGSVDDADWSLGICTNNRECLVGMCMDVMDWSEEM